jgi:hypothetical protein
MALRNYHPMKFYIGLHIPKQAERFERAFISVNRVYGRQKPVPSKDWILDSGAFTEISRHGEYRHVPWSYAYEVNRLASISPGLIAAVSQDYMCEPHILQKTGLTIANHQRLTIERYDELRSLVRNVYLMPVLQGYHWKEYLNHIDQYGSRLAEGAYVGVGSICKRNANMAVIEALLCTIKKYRPDLRLHGFGLKATALASGVVRDCLYSADSMAWSFAARREGRNANCWKEASKFIRKIETQSVQLGWHW